MCGCGLYLVYHVFYTYKSRYFFILNYNYNLDLFILSIMHTFLDNMNMKLIAIRQFGIKIIVLNIMMNPASNIFDELDLIRRVFATCL